MNYPSIDYLVTIVGLSEEDILLKVKNMNIEGNVIVGNQKCNKDEVKNFSFKDFSVTIVNQTSIGTSKNRNTIFKYAKSDYVTFWDDDSIMFEDGNKTIKDSLVNLSSYDAVRFNNISDNENRPIKQINFNGIVSFNTLRSFGVCGIFFKREYLFLKELTFREDIGPGSKINHGEDAVFLKSFYNSGSKIYQVSFAPFHIVQDDSCWFEKTDYKKYYFDQGYLYYILYKNFAYLFGLIHYFRHRKIYKLSFKDARKAIREGISASKHNSL